MNSLDKDELALDCVASRRKTSRGRIGVFGIGLHAYWEQFPGLEARLNCQQREVEDALGRFGIEVISAGLVDTAPRAAEAGRMFAASGLDLILCYVGTYATSSQVLPVVQRSQSSRAGAEPATGPGARLREHRYGRMAGQLLHLLRARRSRTPSPARAFRSAVVSGTPAATIPPPGARSKTGAMRPARPTRFAAAASASSATPIRACSTCTRTSPCTPRRPATHIEVLEMCDLAKCVEAATDAEVAAEARRARRRVMFTLRGLSSDRRRLHWAARVAVGLDRLVGGFRPRRAHLLLPRPGRQRVRAARRRPDPRQLAAHRRAASRPAAKATSRPAWP